MGAPLDGASMGDWPRWVSTIARFSVTCGGRVRILQGTAKACAFLSVAAYLPRRSDEHHGNAPASIRLVERSPRTPDSQSGAHPATAGGLQRDIPAQALDLLAFL